jgi:hypothetical protein
MIILATRRKYKENKLQNLYPFITPISKMLNTLKRDFTNLQDVEHLKTRFILIQYLTHRRRCTTKFKKNEKNEKNKIPSRSGISVVSITGDDLRKLIL